MTNPADSYSSRARALWRLPNVVGIGVGHRERDGEATHEMALTVAVSRKVPSADLSQSERIPPTVGELVTDVIEVGELVAQCATANAPGASRERMLRPGLSISHPDGTAGTLGPLVERDGRWYWLSCNHVMALSNRAHLGDPVLQPASADGGTLGRDEFARLVDFIPLRFLPSSALGRLWARLTGAPTNLVDAALACPVHGTLGLSLPTSARDPLPGEHIAIDGRTSGEVAGRIRAVVVSVRLGYDGGRAALFRSQTLATGMTRGGDSGAAVLDAECRLAGMVIGGSDKATVITPIRQIRRALRVRPVCTSRAKSATKEH